MARQEHEHGFLGNIGQAYARDVSGGIEAQGRPQADAQPGCLQAEDLADGTGGGVDDPVAPHPELLGQSHDVAGQDDGGRGPLAVVVVQEVRRGQELQVTPLVDEPEAALTRVRLIESRLQTGDVLDEDVLTHAVRGDLSKVRGDELTGLGRGGHHREQVLAGDGRAVLLPALTLAIAMGAKYTRQIRAVVLEELAKPYVVGARARGVKERTILVKSVLRSSLVLIVTLLALSMGSLLGGTAIVETIFLWDGVGKMAVEAVLARDYPLVQAYVAWMAVIYVVLNLAADIFYRLLDPRVGYEKAGAL